MTIEELRKQARQIWGEKQMSLEEISVALGVVYGDICREVRAQQEGKEIDKVALQKEMGNVIFSMIRWCDELGFEPEACIKLAKVAQEKYAARLSE